MKKPNIVYIISDQHNASVMKTAGDAFVSTPNLDALADNGVRFDTCYCASPLCVPSRMSLLTGQLPQKCDVMSQQQILDSALATFAHSATAGGYQSILCGRMHFGGHDQYHGFEQRLVGDNGPKHHGRDRAVLEKNFGDFATCVPQRRDNLKMAGSGSSAVYQFDNDVTHGAIEFLENRTDERPLLLTVGLFAPHPPYVAPKERFEYYKSVLPDPVISKEFRENMHPQTKLWLDSRDAYDVTMEEWRNMRAAYYAMVEFLDYNVGRVVETAKRILGEENTIFIYSSDHGEGMGINGMPWKLTFFDPSAKVPLILSCPSQYKSGLVVKEPMSLLDLTATMTAICQSPSLPHAFGMDLSNVLSGAETMADDRTIISQIGCHIVSPPAKPDIPGAMIRKGRYKLIKHHGFDLPQLFDMELDPLETHNLAQEHDYQTLVKNLSEELTLYWNEEQAHRTALDNMEHFKILTQWGQAMRTNLDEQWAVDTAVNYLD